MSTYSTVTRCRHPLVRRKALALLQRSNRQEGVWHSIGCAAVGERLIKIEEEGLGITIPLPLSLSATDLDKWADSIDGDGHSDWLDGDEAWLTDGSWVGSRLVPERQRLVDTLFSADADTGIVDLTIIFFRA